MPNGSARNPQTTRRARVGWIAVPLLIACGGNDPATQLGRAGSWAATTRELAIERRVGAVGRAYTADLLDAGQRDVQQIAQSLKPSELPETVRSRVPVAIGRLDSLIATTGSAVRRGDAVALGTASADANALADTFRILRAALGGK